MHHTNLTVEVKVVGSPTVVIVVVRTVSSAHGAKQRHPRFLTPPTSYPAARNYAIPTGVIGRRRSSPFQPRCPCTWQTIGSSMSAADDGKLSNWPVKQS